MSPRIVVDTGPLVAAFDKSEQWAPWTADALRTVRGPMLTCEAVLAESWFLLQHHPIAWAKIEKWMDRGFLKPAFSLDA